VGKSLGLNDHLIAVAQPIDLAPHLIREINPIRPMVVFQAEIAMLRAYTLVSMAAACAGFGAFIVVVGNHQFCAADGSFLIDPGWRLIQGQVPYRDFVLTLPPDFFLETKYAYRLFGVQWPSYIFL
jgi:hypothetical protein